MNTVPKIIAGLNAYIKGETDQLPDFEGTPPFFEPMADELYVIYSTLKKIKEGLPVSGGGGGSYNTTLAFNSEIPFSYPLALMFKLSNGPVNFTAKIDNAVAGSETVATYVADGVNTPTFDGLFKLQSGSDVFSNVAGRVHQISFWFDGHYFYYKISQSHTIALPDTVGPVITSITAINATTIRVVCNENSYGTSAGVSFTKNGANLAITAVAGSGTNTFDFTVGSMLRTDVLKMSFNSVMGDIADAAGNKMLSFTNVDVNNNVPALGPVPVSATINNGTPNVVWVPFDKALDFSGTPPSGSFSIAGHYQSGFFAWPAGNGYGIGLGPDATPGESLTLVYTHNPANPILGTDGTVAASFTIPITNNL